MSARRPPGLTLKPERGGDQQDKAGGCRQRHGRDDDGEQNFHTMTASWRSLEVALTGSSSAQHACPPIVQDARAESGTSPDDRAGLTRSYGTPLGVVMTS